MKTMIFAQNADKMRALCGIARQFDGAVEAIAIGEELKAAAVADKVWFLADQGCMFEDYSASVAALIKAEQPQIVLFEQSTRMRVVAGRVGAILGLAAFDSVATYDADGAISHIAYGGIAVKKEQVTGGVALLLIDANAYDAAEPTGACEAAAFDFVAPVAGVKVLEVKPKESSGVDLGAADKVVGIGRGISKEEDLEMVRAFAAATGAAIGCTRPVAEEEKWLPREAYIGVSGITISPDVYFAVGISGQVQHTIGVNNSGKIIAINKDKNAMIFKNCDLGIVGDLYKVLPAVTEALQ